MIKGNNIKADNEHIHFTFQTSATILLDVNAQEQDYNRSSILSWNHILLLSHDIWKRKETYC